MRKSILIVLAVLLASAVQCDVSPPTPTANPTLPPPSAPVPPTATPSPTVPTSPTAAPSAPPEPTTVPPSPTSSQPVVLARGQFVDANNTYHGSGTVTVVKHPDGRLVLQFTDFTVSDGPGLHVVLATTAAPRSAADLEGHVDLGELQRIRGDQTYDIPGDVDLARYQSAVIYCVPFKVLFAYATLVR